MPNPVGAAGDRLADAAEPDEPERRAVHVAAEVLHDPPALPAVAAQVGFGVVREAGRGEDQQEREVGGGLVEHARRVADRDAELGGRGDVDVVVADRDVRDDPQPPAGGAGFEHLAVDAIGEQAHDRVGIRRGAHQLVVGERDVVVALHELVTRVRQRLQPAVGQPAGDEDSAHVG